MPATLRMELFPSDLDAFVAFWTTVLGFNLVRRDGSYCAVRRDTILIGAVETSELLPNPRWAPGGAGAGASGGDHPLAPRSPRPMHAPHTLHPLHDDDAPAPVPDTKLHGPAALYAMRAPPVGVEIVIEVDNIQAEYARVAPLTDMHSLDRIGKREWGLTDFRVFDPFGHYVRFTNRRQGGELEYKG